MSHKNFPKHIAVLGDSVFDNQNYLHPDEKDGQARLQDAFPDYHLTFLAIDGHKSDNVRNTQLKYLADAVKKKPISDIILSVGGNDLLDCAFLLGEKPKSVGQALSVIREYQQTFAESYAKTIEAIDDTVYEYCDNVRWHVCNIYYPCLDHPNNNRFPIPNSLEVMQACELAVDAYNQVITKAFSAFPKEVIDMNWVFWNKRKTFYANPIEPSSEGSRQLAQILKSRIDRRSQ